MKKRVRNEIGFDVDEFIVMDEFMDVVSGFKAIEERLPGREWTEEEIEILKKWYPVEGSKVIDKLSGRTKGAIQSMAIKLSLLSPGRWTDKEIEILKEYYSIEGIKVKDRLSSKTKSAIESQASKLGLKAPNNL